MKKTLSILLSILMVLSALAVMPINAFAEETIQISNYDQLKAFADRVNGGETNLNAELTADITAGDKKWIPIGYAEDGSNAFTGTFNGNLHTITGLSNQNVEFAPKYAGLFGAIGENGEVKNTIVNGVDMKTEKESDYIGAVVGYNNRGKITNCANTGDITGYSENIGGIAGYNINGTISNCYNTGNITGEITDIYVGGITSTNESGEIVNCFNTGKVKGTATDPYGRACVGGICGINYGRPKSPVHYCYSAGEVEGRASGSNYIGALIGKNTSNNFGVIENSYYNSDIVTAYGATGEGDIGENVKGLTTAEMTAGTYTDDGKVTNMPGFSSDDWLVKKEGGFYAYYPHLKGFKYDLSQSVEDWPAVTINTDSDVYHISNYKELKLFAQIVNGGNCDANAELTAYIVCNDTSWTPIGTESNPFKGTFDGKGYTITGLSTPADSTNNYVGLFGYVDGGTVKNVGLEDGAINGKEYVGGIVGYLKNGTVRYCYNTGKLTASGDTVYVGGIAGKIDDNSLVTKCYNTGEILIESEPYNVGGIAGQNANSSIVSCYNIATLTTTVCGVSDSSSFGGIAGMATCDSADAIFKDCYNAGSCYHLAGDRLNPGGVIGFSNNVDNSHSIYVQSCYYDIDFYNAGNLIGHIKGNIQDTNSGELTTGQMTGVNAFRKMQFLYQSDWFTKSETKDADGNYCLCYPHLKGFNKKADGSQETDSTKIPIDEWPANKPIYIVFDSDSFEYDGNAKTFKVIIGDSYVPESATNVEYYVADTDLSAWIYYGDTVGYIADTHWVKYETDSAIVNKTFKGLLETTEEDICDYYCRYYDLNRKNDDGSFVEVDSLTNAGKYRIEIVFEDEDYDGYNVYYGSPRSNFEKDIEITPKPAKVKVSSADFTYNGTAQSSTGITVEGLLGNDALKANISSSITFPSESPVENKVDSIEFTTGLKDNYDITTENGQLTMTKASNAIGITAASQEWTYDGNAHSNNAVTVTSGELFTGDELVANATGSVTDVSDTETDNNQIASGYKIMHGDTDVTENYVITPVAGTLKINKANATVTITGHNNTTVFDGDEHTVSDYTVETSNSLYKESDFTFSGTAEANRTDAGTTNMGLNASQFTNTNPNFDVTFNVTDGYQNIVPISVEVTITGNSETADYDGQEHSASGYTFAASNPLYKEGDFTFSGTAEAKLTEPGTESMGLDASQFTNTNTNFDTVTFVIAEDGKITVNPVIKFVNEDGTVLQSSAYAMGETPEYKGETPVKAASDGCTYEFAGWTPAITEVTGNATYTAVYTSTAIGLELKEGTNDTTGYKEDQTFTVDTSNLPEGAEVHWFVNGEDVGTGESYTVEDPTEDYTVQAKVIDSDGEVLAETEEQKVTVKNGFFDRLKWFFNNFWANILKTFIDALIAAC